MQAFKCWWLQDWTPGQGMVSWLLWFCFPLSPYGLGLYGYQNPSARWGTRQKNSHNLTSLSSSITMAASPITILPYVCRSSNSTALYSFPPLAPRKAHTVLTELHWTLRRKSKQSSWRSKIFLPKTYNPLNKTHPHNFFLSTSIKEQVSESRTTLQETACSTHTFAITYKLSPP